LLQIKKDVEGMYKNEGKIKDTRLQKKGEKVTRNKGTKEINIRYISKAIFH
jgi:hypothetical protein